MSEELAPILDLPSSDPGLGFEPKARMLAALIQHAEQGRLTIGVFGSYGSGKSTLMDRIKHYLDLHSKEEDADLVTVKFNAWQYDQERYLFLPFLAAIRRCREIRRRPSLSRRFEGARDAFVRGVSIELNLGLAKIHLSGDKARNAEDKHLKGPLAKVLNDYVDVYDELSKVTVGEDDRVRMRIVVFIDDLDRCFPRKALALLEQLKAVMDIPGFSFVVGLDPRVISTYLNQKYRKDFLVDPDEYLQKMFQIPFHLPKPLREDVVSEIGKMLKGKNGKWVNKWAAVVGGQLLHEFAGELPTSIRECKRILNMHQAVMAISEGADLRADVLLALLILQARLPLVFWAMQTLRDDFDNFLYACANNIETKAFQAVAKHRDLVETVKSNEFVSFYEKTLSAHIHRDTKVARPYLDLLGWPVDIESKLRQRNG
jgi:hypothetical protein